MDPIRPPTSIAGFCVYYVRRMKVLDFIQLGGLRMPRGLDLVPLCNVKDLTASRPLPWVDGIMSSALRDPIADLYIPHIPHINPAGLTAISNGTARYSRISEHSGYHEC